MFPHLAWLVFVVVDPHTVMPHTHTSSAHKFSLHGNTWFVSSVPLPIRAIILTHVRFSTRAMTRSHIEVEVRRARFSELESTYLSIQPQGTTTFVHCVFPWSLCCMATLWIGDIPPELSAEEACPHHGVSHRNLSLSPQSTLQYFSSAILLYRWQRACTPTRIFCTTCSVSKCHRNCVS